MARARRRNGRSSTVKTPESGAAPDDLTPASNHEGTEPAPDAQDEEKCPACKTGETTQEWAAADKENWVRCDACKTWYHWRCAGDGGDLDAVDKWFCKACIAQDPSRVITMKPPARKSSRKRTQRDYAGLHNSGTELAPDRWVRILEGKEIKDDPFRRMKGSELSMEWPETDESAMREPIVIETPEGLGMKMPSKDLTVREVAEIIGEQTPVEVIDVATQSNVPGWTLGKWADYYETEPAARDKVRNVISLEISGTELADKVLPPRLVRELDWVDKFWPSTKKGRGNAYPKVQLYCLMGVAGAWTDWHIDFAGSSVYYHILHGSKVFYFIRPTPANLSAYERWSGTEMQNHSWLGDMVDEVFKVELHDGNTMIIPTGWIHAVYTPVDTLVFGGNFLHSYNVPIQLKVREIEIATHVPKKFRFPYFARLCWYTGEKYLRDLKAKEEFSPRVLESVEALADFLVSEARTMEKGTDHAKREAKEQVPGDRIKDAPALARELRWRVRSAAGYSSEDEGRNSRKAVKNAIHEPSSVSLGKRKRLTAEPEGDNAIFRNFKRRPWDRVVELPPERESRVIRARRPAEKDAGWQDEWVQWKEELQSEEGEGGAEAEVSRRRDVIVKLRRTEKGVERQRVERVLEDWVWRGDPSPPASPAAPMVKNEDETSKEEGAVHEPPQPGSDESTADGKISGQSGMQETSEQMVVDEEGGGGQAQAQVAQAGGDAMVTE